MNSINSNIINKNSILIVDDQANNIKIISTVLGEEYNLYIANSGARALQILQKVKPNIILLDIMMPEMDGYEVCRIIKENDETKDIPVIFLTAKSEIDDLAKAFDLGAADYITKPFNVNEVMIRIKNHIALAQAINTITHQNAALLNYQKNLIKLNEELIESKDAIEQNAHYVNTLNEKLIETNDKLSITIKEKDKLFSIIAHDLRSPFSGILGLTEIMASETKDISKEEYFEFSVNLRDSAQRIFQLIENLLEWARMQNGVIKFNPDFVRLNQVFLMNIEDIRAKTELKNLTFINNIDDNIFVYADYAMLNTVSRNLISNAVKFTKEAGTIAINTTETDDFIEVEIKDNGIGIPEKILNKLFLLGENTSRSGTSGEPSSGLGLILCKEFVERNGGKIWVKSTVNVGSSFFFTVPKVMKE